MSSRLTLLVALGIVSLPALSTAQTVEPVVGVEERVPLNTVVPESVVRELVPELVELGAQAIVEYPLNKIVD